MNKLTLTLMCGLPRSGKSTWAKKHKKDAVIISPDRIRKLIFGHQFHQNAEDFVWAYAKSMAKLLMEQNRSIIIDATNLHYIMRNMWYQIAKDYNASIIVVFINTSLSECLRRNSKSKKTERLPVKKLKYMKLIFEDPKNDILYRNYKIKIIRVNQSKSK